jgi:hypothetical protein
MTDIAISLFRKNEMNISMIRNIKSNDFRILDKVIRKKIHEAPNIDIYIPKTLTINTVEYQSIFKKELSKIVYYIRLIIYSGPF